MKRYTAEWFEARKHGAKASARVVLPAVIDLVHPRSIVDVGCGAGSWLVVAAKLGISDTLGVDADHVDRRLLEIAPDQFLAHDLSSPLELDRTFDLALCLEVGEHIPQSSAAILVRSLTRLAPVVLFSAAVPGQGGRRHLNERWPAYWASLFAAEGFGSYDCLRPLLWNRDDVRYFYAQNAVLYASDAAAEWLALPNAVTTPPSLVHPRLYARARTSFPPPRDAKLSAFARFLASSMLDLTHLKRRPPVDFADR
jgi:SAM-dependent methyltransferase